MLRTLNLSTRRLFLFLGDLRRAQEIAYFLANARGHGYRTFDV